MKNTNCIRLAILGFCVAVFAAVSASPAFGQGSSVTTVGPVRSFTDTSIIIPRSGSQLVRSSNGVYASLNTTGLVPGTVASLWIAIFNTPSACATNPCTASDLDNPAVHGGSFNLGARMIGPDGSANFGGFRAVGDNAGSARGTRGLILPFSAEMHLVVRTHGAASSDPALFAQQLSEFNGGCPPNTCSNLQVSVHQQ